MNPTFKIFAPMLKASMNADGKRRLHGIASSTIQDRHGDRIAPSALQDMERAANNNLTIFLNHEYRVPEDVAGYVERAWIRQHPSDMDIHDLAMDIVVNEANPRAVNAWEAIQSGTQLGLSIGAMIPDGGAVRDRKSGAYQIDHLELIETSLVGVPANPRSWVEYAVKSLNAKRESFESELGIVTTIETTDDPEMTVEETITKEVAVEDLPEPEDEPEADDTNEEEEAEEIDPEAILARGGTVDNSTTFTAGEAGPETFVPATTSSSADLTNATVNIETPFANVTIDTGNRGGKSAATDGSSQEAPVSDPENGDQDDAAPVSPWAGLVPVQSALGEEDIAMALRFLEPTVVASLQSSNELLKAITRELIDTKAALERRDDEFKALEAATIKVVTETAQILDKLSNTPVGRRAVVREVSDKFVSLKSVYAEEFLTLLKRS